MFCDDLCMLLQSWRRHGDRIILLMDANNNVHNGKLSQRLAHDLIELKKAVHEVIRGQGLNTHIRGSELIDGIWHTPELCLQGASYLPFNPVLVNLRLVVVVLKTRYSGLTCRGLFLQRPGNLIQRLIESGSRTSSTRKSASSKPKFSNVLERSIGRQPFHYQKKQRQHWKRLTR